MKNCLNLSFHLLAFPLCFHNRKALIIFLYTLSHVDKILLFIFASSRKEIATLSATTRALQSTKRKEEENIFPPLARLSFTFHLLLSSSVEEERERGRKKIRIVTKETHQYGCFRACLMLNDWCTSYTERHRKLARGNNNKNLLTADTFSVHGTNA